MGRYLGQHFLINKDKIRNIVEALGMKDGNVIIEIGPGHGELTDELVNKFISLKVKKFKIIAIEKDKKLAEILRNKMALPYREAPYLDKEIVGSVGSVEVIEGDVLKNLKSQILKLKFTNQKSKIIKNLKIVGNIPYYITGYLLRILGELKNKPSLIILTVQKEVAERICAKPPRMNLLAASVQFWAKPEIVDFISRKDFEPMPKVDSAIIKIMVRPALPYREVPVMKTSNKNHSKNYYRLIKILFKQPRKTIINNLEFRIKDLELRAKNRQKLKEKLTEIGVKPNARPQDLSIGQIKKLAEMV